MQADCVSCHNNHPDSRKHDWKEGDVRGVLEIIRPLEKDVQRTNAGLRGGFLVIAALSVTLLAVSSLALLIGNWRRARVARENAPAPEA
jgi:adenylate cyclase